MKMKNRSSRDSRRPPCRAETKTSKNSWASFLLPHLQETVRGTQMRTPVLGGRSTHCLWYSAPMLSRCCQGNRHSFCWRRSISASLSSNAMHRSRRRTPSGCHWDGNVLITDSGRPNCWAQDAYITSYGCVRDFLNSFGRLRPIVPISLNENQRHREVQWLILGRYRCQTTWDCIKAAKRFYPKIFTNSAVITRTPTTCSWEWAALSSSVCSPSREKSWLEEMHLS